MAGDGDAAADAAAAAARGELVSVIVPARDCEAWLDASLGSVAAQTHRPLEVLLFDDRSSDGTPAALARWRPRLEAAGLRVWVGAHSAEADGELCGPGHARNRCVEASRGEYLCLLDADDVMEPNRVEVQLREARRSPENIVGCRFRRTPDGSTPRYEAWSNRLSDEELLLHRFRECTIIQPTWFFHRRVFDRVGGWRPEPNSEDLMFLHAHVAAGGGLSRCPETLVRYRFHEGQTSHTVRRRRMFAVRALEFERQVLTPGGRFYEPKWENFTIWSVGRDGKDFYRALSREAQAKVGRFCDVNPAKIGKTYADVSAPRGQRREVPIVLWSDLVPPVVTCVALDRYPQFEANLASLNLREGDDYYHFA